MNKKFLPHLLILALINSCIELEISAPSFPDIVDALNTTESRVGLTITLNLIGFSLAALFYGPLSEVYGRRKIMLIGNGILTIGAIGCVIAPTIEWLLAARFVQGIGAATSAVVVSAIIADVYRTDRAARLYGVMNAIFTSLMAAAPILGGLINETIGWRGNYGVVAAICIVSWGALYWFLPESKPTKEDWHIGRIVADYKKLLSSPLFLSWAAIPSILYGCYLAFVAIAPFIYMEKFGMSMFAYTLNQGAVIAAFALASVVSGKTTAKLGVGSTLATAFALSLAGSGLMLGAQGSLMLTSSMSLFSVGFALIYPIIFARSVEIFPEIKGTASSAIMGMRYLICSAITAIASFLYSGHSLTLAAVIFASTLLAGALWRATGQHWT